MAVTLAYLDTRDWRDTASWKLTYFRKQEIRNKNYMYYTATAITGIQILDSPSL